MSPHVAEANENEQVNHQQLITFEGFKPNALQIRNQYIFLHIVACVKIYFGAFWEMSGILMVSVTFGDIW